MFELISFSLFMLGVWAFFTFIFLVVKARSISGWRSFFITILPFLLIMGVITLIAAIAFFHLFSVLPGKPINENTVIGLYQADLPQGAVEKLELLPSGECIQNIHLSDGTIYNAHGKWNFSNKERLENITLYGMRVVLKSEAELDPDIATLRPESEITSVMPIEKSIFGKIELVGGGDIYFKKIK